ncbi:copper homeostasis protein cutC [Metarhizium album ARSEF 1941]|uniref:Copper homeostasis protein cutC homolog n=1 Tax=Metarhizium album (strain ARSEF 1941) TaxID=1081103 RepID=A0A0B2WFB7_METAS|nr:copper homeostasis protein cutC [Metarhizium album ARSEF 1941]KHN94616.1 copper homeostasis protein cutC [Metarhizium album ARSEF 1941]
MGRDPFILVDLVISTPHGQRMKPISSSFTQDPSPPHPRLLVQHQHASIMTPRTTQMPLEVAVFSGESALKAQSQGASRVELNAPGSYHVGGTTPPLSELAKVAADMSIPVRIMIRPRGPPVDGSKDFIYTPDEVASMAQSIRSFKASGLLNPFQGDGFVFGALQPADSTDAVQIDEAACRTLLDAARPFGCVFHRAFDPIAATRRIGDALETLVGLGFEGLLTAGGRGPCTHNMDRLDNECRRQAGRIQVVVGGGLRASNIQPVAERLGAHEKGSVWMHTAALTDRRDHGPEDIDSSELNAVLAILDSVCVP